jgi:hypothetical protein
VPTIAEITAEINAYGIVNSDIAFSSPFKFTVPGFRVNTTAALNDVGSIGYYWSSSVSGVAVHFKYFESGSSNQDDINRATGFSVRCIKD